VPDAAQAATSASPYFKKGPTVLMTTLVWATIASSAGRSNESASITVIPACIDSHQIVWLRGQH
jgi:hypothetical protein